jgi:hypothetical protein
VRQQRIRTRTSSKRMSTSFLLLVASSSILTRMWWSEAGDGRQCYRLNQSSSTYGDVLVSSLKIRWKLDSYSDEIKGNKIPRNKDKGSVRKHYPYLWILRW